VRVTPLFEAEGSSRVSGGQVTFEPGARTAWHTHPRGQTLIVTVGTGRVQHRGGAIQEIRPGDAVRIPPGVKHWRGETVPPSPLQGTSNMSQEPTAAQKLVGDFAAKLGELTDEVLFDDVCERPGLSKRDRSLVTVAALIANGNTEQLMGHLNRAKENGVTEAEVAEVITHLAFYAGWPRAMSAVRVAREVFNR
jgi:4-carboxymuconolactone decarboxylase